MRSDACGGGTGRGMEGAYGAANSASRRDAPSCRRDAKSGRNLSRAPWRAPYPNRSFDDRAGHTGNWICCCWRNRRRRIPLPPALFTGERIDSRLFFGEAIVQLTKHRFASLDWLRGIAALAVLTFHFASESNPTILPHGGLAVDFFFSLSGFVVAYAYEDRLRGGLSPTDFMKLRLIRLYPMLALGVFVGAVGYYRSYSSLDLALAIITALVFLPSRIAGEAEGFNAVAANPPEWTLIFEVYGNIVFGLIAPRMTNLMLFLMILLSAGTYELSFWWFGVEGGFSWPTIIGGVPRFCLSFLIGVALFRLQSNGWLRRTIPLVLSSILLIIVFATPIESHLEWLYNSVSVMLIFPTIIATCDRNVSGWMLPACFYMGETSYPAYILQGGIVPHARSFVSKVGHGGLLSLFLISVLIFVYYLLIFCTWKFIDLPVRRYLIKWSSGGDTIRMQSVLDGNDSRERDR